MELQSIVYEALAFLGPLWSAVCAGFVIIIFGVPYLTQDGQRYLETRGA